MSKEKEILTPVFIPQGDFDRKRISWPSFRPSGRAKLIALVLGWLLLFVLVPPLAVFLLFIPMIMGNERDRIREQDRKKRMFLDQIEIVSSLRGINSDTLTQEAQAKHDLERLRESVRRDLRIINELEQ